MNYRRLGRTNLEVSVIGIGTNQLRRVPEKQAVETLKRAFALGINLVNLEPEYEGADDMLLSALQETDNRDKIIISIQTGGDIKNFERNFEDICKKFDKESFDLFGISSISEQELYGCNVWGSGGLVEFLQKKKQEGRIKGIFASDHGDPDQMRRLLNKDVFDAVMLAYNPLGFHLVTFRAETVYNYETPPVALKDTYKREDLFRTGREIIPLAQDKDVGVMLMKPLAGGLLCSSKAFPGHAWRSNLPSPLQAKDVLRYLLMDGAISCVVPGMASIEEVDENAVAGAGDIRLSPEKMSQIKSGVTAISRVLCSRCGQCDDLCSEGLPVSFIFRAAYHYLYPNAPFGISNTLQYFRLIPSDRPVCESCREQTCQCPSGIDIRMELTFIHQKMVELRNRGLVPNKDVSAEDWKTGRLFSFKVLSKEMPASVFLGERVTVRLHLRNTGTRPWYNKAAARDSNVSLKVYLDGEINQIVRLRKNVYPTDDCHFAFLLDSPEAPGPHLVRMDLFDEEGGPFCDDSVPAIRSIIQVTNDTKTQCQQGNTAVSVLVLEKKEIILLNKELTSSEGLRDRLIDVLRRSNEHLKSQVQYLERQNQELSQKRKLGVHNMLDRPSNKIMIRSALKRVLQRLGLYALLFKHYKIFSPVYNFLFRDTWTPVKSDSDVSVSGSPSGELALLSAEYIENNVPTECVAGSRCVFRVLVKNSGKSAWYRDPPDGHFAALALFIDDTFAESGKAIQAVVEPGESSMIALTIMMPKDPGDYRLKFDMGLYNKTWFSAVGVHPLELSIHILNDKKSRTEELLDLSQKRNLWFFSPSQSVHRSKGKPVYPIFAESTKGYFLKDVDGREFVDIHMGWGCCLLGYCDERIQNAVASSLSQSAGIISLPHHLEIDVSDYLCDKFPFGDEVLFGKNGSDVTTWAVRTARIATGRKTVLFSGYHGWQDWYVGCQGFAASGVPPDNNRYNISLPYRDIVALEDAVAIYKDDIAAIMIEPAATNIDLDDPHHMRDGPYLKKAEELARKCGALFILDEIMTGFRFLNGSAQTTYGLTPDLTCLGKAIANGMPLSALTARHGLLRQCISQIYYAPTMKGEVYSYAAALAALKIYYSEDISGKVWETGDRIRKAVNGICKDLKMNASLIGAPYRMYFHFTELTGEQDVHFRTLLQQELTRNGIISNKGYVILSYSHDQGAVDRCVRGFHAALQTVSEAMLTGVPVQYLDIPDVIMESRKVSRICKDNSQ